MLIPASLVEHVGLPVPPPDAPAPVLAAHEKARVRAAAFRAKRLYPGPVGEVLHCELMAWEQFGYRLGSGNRGNLVHRLVQHLLTAPLP